MEMRRTDAQYAKSLIVLELVLVVDANILYLKFRFDFLLVIKKY